MANASEARCWRSARGTVASVTLLLWLSISLISAFPRLHQWFHHDSGTLKHECLATSVSKGGALPVAQAVHYVPPSSWVALAPTGCAFINHLVSYALPLTRGPPADLFLH
jgi:hypothetical protein